MPVPRHALLPLAAATSVALPLGGALGAAAGWWSPAVTLATAGGSVAGLGALLAAGSALPSWQLYGSMLTRVDSPQLALTFDDGPDERATARILEQLAAHGQRCTCFLLADRARAAPALARRIVEEGHEVGVHGLSHSSRLTWLSPGAGKRWLVEARQVLEDITGAAVRFFRPPFGVTSPRLFAAAEGAELEVAWCSVRTGDGGGIDAHRIAARARAAGPGDIVLLHDGPASTLEALPQILASLARRELQSVTLSELVPR